LLIEIANRLGLETPSRPKMPSACCFNSGSRSRARITAVLLIVSHFSGKLVATNGVRRPPFVYTCLANLGRESPDPTLSSHALPYAHWRGFAQSGAVVGGQPLIAVRQSSAHSLQSYGSMGRLSSVIACCRLPSVALWRRRVCHPPSVACLRSRSGVGGSVIRRLSPASVALWRRRSVIRRLSPCPP